MLLPKWNFGYKKSFDVAGAYSYDANVSLPGQEVCAHIFFCAELVYLPTAWVQLLPHQILSNSEIVAIWLRVTALKILRKS